MNRMGNATNPFQGEHKKVLCVCSAGLLRSPTTAVVLSQEPYNFNTRAAGLYEDFALIIVDQVLLHWADEIVCMDDYQKETLERMVEKFGISKVKIIPLNISDNFEYRDPELINHIKKAYDAHGSPDL